MTRSQTLFRQIAKLADEAAKLTEGETHQAAIEIKLAAECAGQSADSGLRTVDSGQKHPHHD